MTDPNINIDTPEGHVLLNIGRLSALLQAADIKPGEAVANDGGEDLRATFAAKSAHSTSRAFSKFYADHPVLKEGDPVLKASRLALVKSTLDHLIECAGLGRM